MPDLVYDAEIIEFFSKKYCQQFKRSEQSNEEHQKGQCTSFYSDDYNFEVYASFLQCQSDVDKEISISQRIADTLESSDITIEKGKSYRFKRTQDFARSNEQPQFGFFYCIEEI